MKHDVIIVGAGASGIAAAITAKDYGIDAAIVESNDRIGKKLLSTGNGRCNITNENISMLNYHGENPQFPEYILKSFSNKDTENFFSALGLPLITLEDGKRFPKSLQSSSVIDILKLSLEEKDIPIYYNTKVLDIKPLTSGFKLTTSSNEDFYCNKIIICTGGKSAPFTGSDGSGYTLSKKLGHKIVKPLPALVQLKLDYPKIKALSGIKINGEAEIYVDNTFKEKYSGEILFTDYGISGPPILSLSRIASKGLESNKKVTIKVNLLPDVANLNEFLENHWAIFSYRECVVSLYGIINKKIIPILLKEAGLDNIHKPCEELTWKEKRNIINLISSWQFNVSGTNSFSNAQVTAGGIDTTEVDNTTLESKVVSGLFFAGEILDVDGDCGGYNLQWAWSSGVIAAKNCLK